MRILRRAAQLADERAGDVGRTISAEVGKTITEATKEASRSGEIIRLAAFEGTQLYGDTLPLDANPGTGPDKIGFTLRQPCGIVVAISPSTIRRCSFCTRSHRRWPRATRSCSSRQGRRR